MTSRYTWSWDDYHKQFGRPEASQPDRSIADLPDESGEEAHRSVASPPTSSAAEPISNEAPPQDPPAKHGTSSNPPPVPPAVPYTQARDDETLIVLPDSLAAELLPHAEKREIGLGAFVRDLLRSVLDGDLVDYCLVDGEDPF